MCTVVVCVYCLILTTGQVKDPAGRPEHGQTKHRVVEIDLIFGKCSFDPHGDTERAPEAPEHTDIRPVKSFLACFIWNSAQPFKFIVSFICKIFFSKK